MNGRNPLLIAHSLTNSNFPRRLVPHSLAVAMGTSLENLPLGILGGVSDELPLVNQKALGLRPRSSAML